MFAFIRGKLHSATPSHVVLETGGVGYLILIPASLYPELPPQGSELLLYTVHVVREISQTLYGFTHKDECDLFEVLTGVSGIGPKTALAVIGHLNARDLGQAIANANIAAICKVPGIGRKTAERLVLEVRDKLPGLSSMPRTTQGGGIQVHAVNSKIGDAMSALINLGYSQAIAEKALKKTLEGASEDETPLAELITTALQHV